MDAMLQTLTCKLGKTIFALSMIHKFTLKLTLLSKSILLTYFLEIYLEIQKAQQNIRKSIRQYFKYKTVDLKVKGLRRHFATNNYSIAKVVFSCQCLIMGDAFLFCVPQFHHGYSYFSRHYASLLMKIKLQIIVLDANSRAHLCVIMVITWRIL